MQEDLAQNATPTSECAGTDLSVLLIRLLKSVLYRDGDERLWAALLNLQARVRDYVAVLSLELVLDEAEGYAFLRAAPEPADDDPAPRLPRLVARRPLSFPVSLLLALVAQEAGRIRRRRRRYAAGADPRRRSSNWSGCSCRTAAMRPIDRPYRDRHQQGGRAGFPAPAQTRGQSFGRPGHLRSAAHPEGLRRRAMAGRNSMHGWRSISRNWRATDAKQGGVDE